MIILSTVDRTTVDNSKNDVLSTVDRSRVDNNDHTVDG